MKNLFPFLFLSFLFSCHSESKSPHNKNDSNFIADSSKQRLLQIIEGGWVTEDYISQLKKTNSPMASCRTMSYLETVIDISNLRGDTLYYSSKSSLSRLGRGYNLLFTKDSSDKIVIRILDDAKSTTTAFIEYSIEGKDTVIFIKNDNDNKIYRKRYLRQFRTIPTRDSIELTPIEYLVNRTLFEGDWRMNGKLISIAFNGTVRNFKNYTRYSVDVYDENSESHPDVISFYNDSQSESFIFTIIDNKIQLYKIVRNDIFISRGKMVGELEKVVGTNY